MLPVHTSQRPGAIHASSGGPWGCGCAPPWGPGLLPHRVGGQAPLTALWPPLQEDCHGKIDELFSGKLYLIGIAAIVVAVIMVSGADRLCLGIPPTLGGSES